MYNVKCPNCGFENKNTNIRCESCGTELNGVDLSETFPDNDYSYPKVKVVKVSGKKIKLIINIILVASLLLWFVIGLVFIGVSLSSIKTDKDKTANYLETEGKLVGYENCQRDSDGDELCNGVYEYTVGDVVYKGSPNLLSNHTGFKQTVIVKYDPNNPSEYSIYAGWNTLLIVGIVMVIASTGLFIAAEIFLNKFFKDSGDNEEDNEVLTT